MVNEKVGKKYILKFYYESMDRLWRRLLIFDVVIWIAWWFAPILPAFRPPVDELLFLTGLVVTTLMILAWLVRKRGYVQVNRDQLVVGVPLFRVKFPYSAVKSMRITDLKHAIKGVKLNKGDQKFLGKYVGKSPVSALILKEKPKFLAVHRLFFPRYMFLAEDRGMFFYIDDIMAFNSEFDNRLNSSRLIEDMV